MTPTSCSFISQKATSVWAQLAVHEQSRLLIQAQAKALVKKDKIQEELQALSNQHASLLADVEEENNKVPPVKMSLYTLDTTYLDLFERLCTDKFFRSSQNMEPRRRNALDTPQAFDTNQGPTPSVSVAVANSTPSNTRLGARHC